MTQTVLKVNASAQTTNSVSRPLVDQLASRLAGDQGTIIDRDLSASPPPLLNSDWVAANFTPDEDRTPAQRETLKGSDALIAEIEAADALVIGVPIYNFGVPAALKAWVDQVCRARKTFRYTETGPKGLLTGKKAYIVVASGGTASGSAIDFATPYMQHVMGFIGIDDVTVIAADQAKARGPDAIAQAEQAIAAAEA